MTRLLLVIPTLDASGAEKQFSLLAAHLPRDEFEVHAVTLTRGGPYETVFAEHNIPLTILRKKFKFDPITISRLRKHVQELQPEIVHSWLFAGNSYTRMVAGKQPTPKVIVSERCVDSWKSGWQKWLDKRQMDRTCRLVANSESVAEFYRDLGFPAEKTTVIPNAVSLPDVAAFDRSAALQEFDLPDGARVVGYVGRLAKQKRVHDLIWAMQQLRQCTDNVYFVIIGDGPEKHSLVKLAQHFGCDHLVRFAGHREQAHRYMPLFDTFWLASDFEGMSNSVMEAMAAGVPVVASDIPPNRELVSDGETGFLVKVGDCVGFSQFADRILNDDDLKEKLSTASRGRMASEFTLDKFIASHVKLYQSVLSRQSEQETTKD